MHSPECYVLLVFSNHDDPIKDKEGKNPHKGLKGYLCTFSI